MGAAQRDRNRRGLAFGAVNHHAVSPSHTSSPRPAAPGRRVGGALAALALLAAGAAAPATAAEADSPAPGAGGAKPASRFTLAVMPDTQFYSRYTTEETGNLFAERFGSEPYRTQAEWLVSHQDELGIEFLSHLGDVVDQAHVEGEWEVADEAMAIIDDSALNYSILPGNHDLTEDGSEPTHYARWFPASRAARNDTFIERFEKPNMESEAHVFNAEGQDYLVLALAWRADDDALAWAQRVLNEHPDTPAIVTSHEILDVGSSEPFFSEEYGEHLWRELIAPNDQIFLALGGHNHGAGVRVDDNEHGHPVVTGLMDYQMSYQGGNGLLGLLGFDLTGGALEMGVLSPWVAKKPKETLNQFDELTLDSENDSWRVELDLAGRLRGIDPDWEPGTPDDPDYLARARALVSEGYENPAAEPPAPPAGPEDYPHAAGTLAHWRPRPGEKKTIEDVAGENDMRLRGLATKVDASAERDPRSSAEGSVCLPGGLATARFATDEDAPINDATFEDGYTIEAFLKLDEGFDTERDGWAGALARGGTRQELTGIAEEGGEPPAVLAVSNLAELQWATLPVHGDQNGVSNWSHEIPAGGWHHVAIVNDAAARTVEMRIDGAPILRDVVDAAGIQATGAPWQIGASVFNGLPTNQWNGCIGEVRIADRPLSQDEWLTARAADAEAPDDPDADATPGGSGGTGGDSGAAPSDETHAGDDTTSDPGDEPPAQRPEGDEAQKHEPAGGPAAEGTADAESDVAATTATERPGLSRGQDSTAAPKPEVKESSRGALAATGPALGAVIVLGAAAVTAGGATLFGRARSRA
ncbi:hypothetical protein HMPREF9719_00726 [Corynebacterium otitidis ATCC 51513]|uniref:Calcineurin-like phosphoesterase domain-containing protein n=2 Tax=Corynebacterium otitidis TaxID=29321 RepID=K0Z4L8_9CORY|nr:hypothetical protein HMPREF9719_00726 [Corynebacterium otitidis ATCC 51513]